jgi:DNA-binding NarL/FixJ family response regulator
MSLPARYSEPHGSCAVVGLVRAGPAAPFRPPGMHPTRLMPPLSASKSMRVNVVVIDDHPAIRDAIADTVGDQPDMELCGVAGSAHEAFELVRAARPDVAVVDISLGDAHGLDLIQNLRAQHPALEVVVFSMYDEAVYAERAIRAGARGYVMKSESTQSVAEAIRAAAQGQAYRPPNAHPLASNPFRRG